MAKEERANHERTRQEWSDVSDRLEALALKLKMHLRQARSESASGAEASDAPGEPVGGEVVSTADGGVAPDRTDGLAEALETVRRGIEDAFDAAGNAIRDEAVRADFRELGRLVSGNLSTGWNRATEDIKDLLKRR